MEKIPNNFNQSIIGCRKDMMLLHSYYEQLGNLGEVFCANANRLLAEGDRESFSVFVDRVYRLHNHTEFLREYMIQIREMYQAQLDIYQNRTMNWLTIITTIFFPLSLLVGWYGMNFAGMPELTWKYGYLCMIGVSILTVVIEIRIFKKRHIL